MNRIIPIMPCQSIKEQAAFYEALGFTTLQMSTRPNPYLSMRYGELEIHFYGSKKTVAVENATMCYIKVDDVAQIYEEFTSNLKRSMGKIPRSGYPRISKLKDLTDDQRFIVTDLSGNTLYIGTPNSDRPETKFWRSLESAKYAEHFDVLYDLTYSKEDYRAAQNMLDKFFPAITDAFDACALDWAKVLLVALELHKLSSQTIHKSVSNKLQQLLDANGSLNPEWAKIKRKYDDILTGE